MNFSEKIILLVIAALLFSCGHKYDTGSNNKDTVVAAANEPVSVLDKKIQSQPNNPELYYERSKWNLNMKNMNAAENDSKKALSLDSTKAAYYVQYGDVLFTKMDVEGAEAAFGKAAALEPQNIDAHLKLAELELYLRNYTESLKNADAALQIDKHRAKAYFIKGFVFKETHDTSRAISSFQTCVEQNPDYYEAYVQLGNLFAATNNRLAEQYYTRALQLQPHSVEVFYNRGLYYQNTNQLDKATNDYNELLKINPNYADAYFNLGYIEVFYRNNYKKAIEFFTQSLDRQKYNARALYNRGYCYEQTGNRQQAANDYGEALNVMPTYALAKEGLKRVNR